MPAVGIEVNFLEENGVDTVGVGVGEDIPNGVSSPIDVVGGYLDWPLTWEAEGGIKFEKAVTAARLYMILIKTMIGRLIEASMYD